MAKVKVLAIKANDDQNRVEEDRTLIASGNVLTNDSGRSISVLNPGTFIGVYGTLVIRSDGSYTYTLDNASDPVQRLTQGESVRDVFTYRAGDSFTSDSALLVIKVTGSADAAVAHPDTAYVQEDGTLVAHGNVLVNDTTGDLRGCDHNHQDHNPGWDDDDDFGDDYDGLDGSLRVLLPGAFVGNYGTLILHADGSYTYTLSNQSVAVQSLAQGETVTDTFGYTALDECGNETGSQLVVSITGTNDKPTITNVPAELVGAALEDGALTAIGQLSATDVDHFSTQIWSVQGSASGIYGSFTVDQTGKWTYTLDNAAHQELAQQESHDEIFMVRVADDKGAFVDQTVTVTVTGANDIPVITSAAAASFAENATGTAYTAIAADADIGSAISYALGGTDAAQFTIDSVTGEVSFVVSPDFEAPTDAGADNVYDITVTASDGTHTSVAQAVAITVTDVNEGATVIAGQAVISLGAFGNLIAPVQVDGGNWYYFWDRSGNGTSANPGSSIPYSAFAVDSGADYTFHDVLNGIFNQDINGVVCGDGFTTETYRYATLNGVRLALPTVGGVAYPPYGDGGIGNFETGTEIGSAVAASGSNALNATYNDLLAIWDAYNGTEAGIDIFGAPSGWIDIDLWSATPSGSGHARVNLSNGSVYDVPDAHNGYVALQVFFGDNAPVITSAAAASFAENATGTAYTAIAADADIGSAISYALGGTDAAQFTIDSVTGEVSFVVSPDFEAPTDAGADNVYDITVTASDGTHTSVAQAVAITVTDVNEGATVIAGQAVISLGAFGNLIAPVQVDGGNWYYFWDRSGDGTSADTGTLNGGADYTPHDVLDGIFNQDINGVVGGNGVTTETYRYATLNGVHLALPTYGAAVNPSGLATPPQGMDADQNGTTVGSSVASHGSNALNSTYNDLLAVWDAYNGIGTEANLSGVPSGWFSSNYWSATPSSSIAFPVGHSYVGLYSGVVGSDDGRGNAYVALQVLNVVNEVVTGSPAADVLSGGIGNDVISGLGGADTLTGNAGADRFYYGDVTEGNDVITDFTLGLGGDVLDLRDVLIGYTAGSNINDFVQSVADGENTQINVNADGDGIDFVPLVILQGIAMTGSLLNGLLAQENLYLG